jgi:serine/threonine protein kinase
VKYTNISGAFSEVKLGIERKTGHRVAIKIIDRSKCKGKEDMIETEVKILSRIDHPNIVKLYEMYEFEGKIYLVMELVTGGELFDQIVGKGCYPEKEAAQIVRKILLAINYLHDMGIVHRDLKPENLLLSEKSNKAELKISDFGLSKIFSDVEVMKTACGTPGYVAPEVLKRQGYGQEVDMWSLGVITYILLCGYPPFYDQKNAELFKKIMAGRYQFDHPWWDHISDKAKDFVRKLLVIDIKKRINAKDALSHPFIVQNHLDIIPSPLAPQLSAKSPISQVQSPPTGALPILPSIPTSPKVAFKDTIEVVSEQLSPEREIYKPQDDEDIPAPRKLTAKSNTPATPEINSNETVCSRSSDAAPNSKHATSKAETTKKNAFQSKVMRLASWIRGATVGDRPRSAK